MARKNKVAKMIAKNREVLKSIQPPTKKFNKVQLLSLTDGRMSTDMGDIYKMLSHLVQDSLNTVALVVAHRKLKRINPDWFARLSAEAQRTVAIVGEKNFKGLISYTMKRNRVYAIPAFAVDSRTPDAADENEFRDIFGQ